MKRFIRQQYFQCDERINVLWRFFVLMDIIGTKRVI